MKTRRRRLRIGIDVLLCFFKGVVDAFSCLVKMNRFQILLLLFLAMSYYFFANCATTIFCCWLLLPLSLKSACHLSVTTAESFSFSLRKVAVTSVFGFLIFLTPLRGAAFVKTQLVAAWLVRDHQSFADFEFCWIYWLGFATVPAFLMIRISPLPLVPTFLAVLPLFSSQATALKPLAMRQSPAFKEALLFEHRRSFLQSLILRTIERLPIFSFLEPIVNLIISKLRSMAAANEEKQKEFEEAKITKELVSLLCKQRRRRYF